MKDACSFCGNRNLSSKAVQYIYRHEGKMLVVNGVPCEECTYCGERYFAGPVLERIEREFMRIYREGKKPRLQLTVPVEEYAEVTG
jgi:YgiT-type zinc finger domain-containing protein